jgi:hypothetical protein
VFPHDPEGVRRPTASHRVSTVIPLHIVNDDRTIHGLIGGKRVTGFNRKSVISKGLS